MHAIQAVAARWGTDPCSFETEQARSIFALDAGQLGHGQIQPLRYTGLDFLDRHPGVITAKQQTLRSGNLRSVCSSTRPIR